MSDTPVTAPAEKTAEKRLYKSTLSFCTVTTNKGHSLHFKGGMFITNHPEYVEFLDKEIAANGFNGAIYIDPEARTVTAEQENPMLALERMFYEKFAREQAEKLNPSQDLGTSEQGKLNAGNTTTIAPVAAGGGPATPAAALMSKLMTTPAIPAVPAPAAK
jgi:hypothetical protein